MILHHSSTFVWNLAFKHSLWHVTTNIDQIQIMLKLIYQFDRSLKKSVLQIMYKHSFFLLKYIIP
jgi:hypothetical protein